MYILQRHWDSEDIPTMNCYRGHLLFELLGSFKDQGKKSIRRWSNNIWYIFLWPTKLHTIHISWGLLLHQVQMMELRTPGSSRDQLGFHFGKGSSCREKSSELYWRIMSSINVICWGLTTPWFAVRKSSAFYTGSFLDCSLFMSL